MKRILYYFMGADNCHNTLEIFHQCNCYTYEELD